MIYDWKLGKFMKPTAKQLRTYNAAFNRLSRELRRFHAKADSLGTRLRSVTFRVDDDPRRTHFRVIHRRSK